MDKLFFVYLNVPLNCYLKSGRYTKIFNSEYKYKERVALNKCIWYLSMAAVLASVTYGCTHTSFKGLDNNSRKFKWNCLDICSVDDDVTHILGEKIATDIGDGWIDVDLSSAMDKMNKTMFLRNLQYHNVYDGLIDEIKSYFSNETKFKQPFMKLKLEECSKRALTSADVLSIVYVLWGILLICIIQAILDHHGYLKWFYPEIYPDIETIHNVN